MEKIKIGGMMKSDNRSLIRIVSVPDRPDAAGEIMRTLGENGINSELAVQSFDGERRSHFTLVTPAEDLRHALSLLENVHFHIQAEAVEHEPAVAIISVFGPHLREKPVVPGVMFTALGKAGISVMAISTSISSVSCVVTEADLEKAVEALLDVFHIPFQVSSRPKTY